MNIQHASIVEVNRAGTTISGNPWYQVYIADEYMEPRVLYTKKDAAVNYLIPNKEWHWPRRVTLIMDRQRIVHILEEA